MKVLVIGLIMPTSTKPDFDYTKYDTNLVTPSSVKKMLEIALDPKGGVTKKIINLVQLIVAGICMFILWRLREAEEAKHKQKYEVKETNDNQNEIDDDDLD